METTGTGRSAGRRSAGFPGSLAEQHAPGMGVASAGPGGAQMMASGDAAYAPGFDVTPGEDEATGPRVRTGGCLCGAVRYEVHGEPKLVGLCHCGDCRKATGGNALFYADWPVAAVRIEGVLASYSGRSFCPDCGSRVVHFNAHHTEVLLGTLDEPPTDLVPRREIWTIRREPWLRPIPGAEQFERDPA